LKLTENPGHIFVLLTENIGMGKGFDVTLKYA
jgi:hypothetical protein